VVWNPPQYSVMRDPATRAAWTSNAMRADTISLLRQDRRRGTGQLRDAG
jgi:hypothetical protein